MLVMKDDEEYADDVIGLYLAFLPQYTLEEGLAAMFCQVSDFSL